MKDTYGTKRKVSMEVKKPEKVEHLNLAERLGVTAQECSMEVDKEQKVLTVTFDKHKLQVPQIMNAVMELTEVQDVKIQETELAEIVKQIYNHGFTGQEA